MSSRKFDREDDVPASRPDPSGTEAAETPRARRRSRPAPAASTGGVPSSDEVRQATASPSPRRRPAKRSSQAPKPPSQPAPHSEALPVELAPTSVPATNGPQASAVDLHQRIAQLAYEFYERRGCHGGYELEDWLEAERHVLATLGRSASGRPGMP